MVRGHVCIRRTNVGNLLSGLFTKSDDHLFIEHVGTPIFPRKTHVFFIGFFHGWHPWVKPMGFCTMDFPLIFGGSPWTSTGHPWPFFRRLWRGWSGEPGRGPIHRGVWRHARALARWIAATLGTDRFFFSENWIALWFLNLFIARS